MMASRSKVEVEVGGGGGEAVEVFCEEVEVSVPEHGFDELEVVGGVGEEGGFEEALAVLGCGVGVGYYASAYSHGGVAVVEGEGADGYVERGVAVGGDVADGSGVDAARVLFEVADDLHGADFWGSGDGAAGEEGAEDFVEGEVGAVAWPEMVEVICRRVS